MATKTYCLRLNDERLIAEITAYSVTHAVPESVALSRLLQEGCKAREGKAIIRWASLDPRATKLYCLALGELQQLTRAIRGAIRALQLPRPLISDAEILAWETQKKAAENAFGAVAPKIDALRRAGRLELLMHEASPAQLANLYKQGVDKKIPELVALIGALTGKDTRLPDISGVQPGARQ